jgi:hypothetical protein
MNTDVSQLRPKEMRILTSFPQRFIEIAAVSGVPGVHRMGAPTTVALNTMHLPAIALDRHGFVV